MSVHRTHDQPGYSRWRIPLPGATPESGAYAGWAEARDGIVAFSGFPYGVSDNTLTLFRTALDLAHAEAIRQRGDA